MEWSCADAVVKAMRLNKFSTSPTVVFGHCAVSVLKAYVVLKEPGQHVKHETESHRLIPTTPHKSVALWIRIQVPIQQPKDSFIYPIDYTRIEMLSIKGNLVKHRWQRGK